MNPTSGALENQMNEHFGCAPETCRLCGSMIWADQENEVFVDSRELTDSCENGSPTSDRCPGTTTVHEPS